MNYHLLLPALALLAQPLRAEGEATVVCGKDTVVLFHDTKSPDGQYALGWTIQPIAKDAKPVDWAKFEKEGVGGFDDDFVKSLYDHSEAYSKGEEEARVVGEKAGAYDDDSTLKAYRKARNQEALRLTRERVEVLEKRLHALKIK